MELFAIVVFLTAIILFWGMLRNVRTAGEITSLGLVASATTYTATSAKNCTPEQITTVASLREL